MNTWWTHPRHLAAYAAAARADADLREGVHLRLLPSRLLGFALAPMPLWTVRPRPLDPLTGIDWFDRDGRPWTSGLLDDAAGGEVIGWFRGGLPDDVRLLGVEATFADGRGEIALIDRIDQRLVCARSRAPFTVAAPAITLVRLRGRGHVRLRGWVLDAGRVFEAAVGAAPLAMLSAPINGDRPWYAGGEGSDRAMRRVEEAAPPRWTPPDRPDGPLDPLQRAAEVNRLAVLREAIDDDFERMVRDPDRPPHGVSRSHEWAAGVLESGRPRPWQQASYPLVDSLLARSMDPGVARYLGLMTLLDLPAADLPPVVVTAGLFALGPESAFEMPGPDAWEQRLIERLMQMQPGLADVQAYVVGSGQTLRVFVATALAAPAPDPLPAPRLALGDSLWQREDEGPSWRFRQQLRVLEPPLVALAALARQVAGGGAWISRHALLDMPPGADPAQRAQALLLGTSARLDRDRAGVLAEGGIPAADAPWNYRVALADIFGRWGAAADIAVPAPPRPALPRPVMRTHVDATEAVLHDNPASPGTLRAWVQVPALVELTAGSRPLANLQVQCDGQADVAAAPQAGGELAFSFALPALARSVGATFVVSTHFVDDLGNSGQQTQASVTVHDPRPPRVPAAGIGLLWTSRPGPAAEVDCTLRLVGAPNLAWRVYLADARALDIDPQVDGRARTRAEIAVTGANIGLAAGGPRARFRLLTEEPVLTAADGRLLWQMLLPRSLQTVQFLRFVPIDAQRREAPFERCPLVPVAVPSDRAPPAPRVEAAVNAVTGLVQVRVHAVGIDRIALQAAEPGLWADPPDADSRAPEVRLRRAAGAVPDPLYARVVAHADARRSPVADERAAAVDEFVSIFGTAELPAPLTPYVRVSFWAELRMPAERRLPAGVQEIALPGGAVTTEPPSLGLNDATGAWSAPSAPATVVHVPAEVPTLAAATVTARIGASAVPGKWRAELSIKGAPVALAAAVAPFRIQLHLQLDGGDWEAIPGELALVSGKLAWALERAMPGPPWPALRLAAVLIDPVRRSAPAVIVDAVAE